MTSVSVVVPVKNGGELLSEVLQAIVREQADQLIVIDSGSSDGSAELAETIGAQVIRIEAAEFGHGRTRNVAAEAATGELVCFLTQDATPVAGWLAAYLAAFATDERIGAAFGPHLPRPGSSPTIARELDQFFGGFSRSGEVTVQAAADEAGWHPGFLSNVNAAYRRAVLLDLGFRDVEYAEDQAFAGDLFAAGWLKAFVPGAAVLHSHSYSQLGFIRRYFDEYRGLRQTVGHVEALAPLSAAKKIGRLVAADERWLAQSGGSAAERIRLLPSSTAHHAGRHIGAVLGSRADRLPASLQRSLSLEARDGAGRDGREGAVVRGKPIAAQRDRELFYEMLDLDGQSGAPLLNPTPGMSEAKRLHIAVVIPSFRTGSGGHDTIFRIFQKIEQLGHSCSIWLADPMQRMKGEWPAVIRRRIRDEFVELDAPVYKGFDDWFGADVVLATSWETVAPVLQLPSCRARAYFVQDYEPSFSPTSAESIWAEDSYRKGLFAICASPWLAQLMRERYSASASVFQLGVDSGVYYPRQVERQPKTIAFYGRAATPRRAVPLGMLALAELHRRHPDLRIVIYGDRHPLESTFPYEYLGVASQEQLATLYSEATVGLCLSVTNYSRAPQEMMACGLPCVDLAGFSAESVFGEDGPVALSEFSPKAIAGHMEQLLQDQELWNERSQAGIEFAARHSWGAAAVEVEAGLRDALREQEASGRQA